MQDVVEKKVRLGSATLAYFERNTHLKSKGPTLLFVHATGFHARVWDKIINSIGKFHSISIDQRGHGRSEKLLSLIHISEPTRLMSIGEGGVVV